MVLLDNTLLTIVSHVWGKAGEQRGCVASLGTVQGK